MAEQPAAEAILSTSREGISIASMQASISPSPPPPPPLRLAPPTTHRYPRQPPALTSALQTWLSTFQTDWDGNETTQQLHAHISQRQVQQLCQTLLAKKQRLKATKDEVGGCGDRVLVAIPVVLVFFSLFSLSKARCCVVLYGVFVCSWSVVD